MLTLLSIRAFVSTLVFQSKPPTVGGPDQIGRNTDTTAGKLIDVEMAPVDDQVKLRILFDRSMMEIWRQSR